METKWYSDIWQLIVAPFKRGIPQIVEHGSCRKGLWHWYPWYSQISCLLL